MILFGSRTKARLMQSEEKNMRTKDQTRFLAYERSTERERANSSLNRVASVCARRPAMWRCAGFRDWPKEKGLAVRKLEKGRKILCWDYLLL